MPLRCTTARAWRTPPNFSLKFEFDWSIRSYLYLAELSPFFFFFNLFMWVSAELSLSAMFSMGLMSAKFYFVWCDYNLYLIVNITTIISFKLWIFNYYFGVVTILERRRFGVHRVGICGGISYLTNAWWSFWSQLGRVVTVFITHFFFL